MKLNTLILSMCSMLPYNMLHAAALDQSGQSILAFLENKNYFEASIVAVDPHISGKIRDRPDLVGDSTDYSTGNMGNNFRYYNAALKLQLNEQFAFGLIYDQPYGANVAYPMKMNNTFSDPQLSNQTTSVSVDTQNINMIFGFSPIKNFQIYAGPVYQTVKGKVSLRGTSYSIFSGYDADMKEDDAIGWLAGVSYQIPDIALKAAITYRSKIDHSMDARETMFGQALELTTPSALKITTPQSVNIDFQTGIYKDTLAYANFRWVNWKDFVIRPTQFGALTEIATSEMSNGAYTGGFDLDSYKKDQYALTLGIGHQFTDQWSASTEVSWDSGTGNPASTLNPTKGSVGLGLGVQFNPTKDYFIAGGFKYLWLGDATAEDGTYYVPIPGIKAIAEQADFKNNYALAYGLKIGYHF